MNVAEFRGGQALHLPAALDTDTNTALQTLPSERQKAKLRMLQGDPFWDFFFPGKLIHTGPTELVGEKIRRILNPNYLVSSPGSATYLTTVTLGKLLSISPWTLHKQMSRKIVSWWKFWGSNELESINNKSNNKCLPSFYCFHSPTVHGVQSIFFSSLEPHPVYAF